MRIKPLLSVLISGALGLALVIGAASSLAQAPARSSAAPTKEAKPNQLTVQRTSRQAVVGRIVPGGSYLPSRLTLHEAAEFRNGLSSAVNQAVNQIVTGNVPPLPTVCYRIPWTDYWVCIDIWIEDSSRGPG